MNVVIWARVSSREQKEGYSIDAQLRADHEKARREGLLALEDDLEEVEDEFMRKGIQLVVDGTDPDIIKSIDQQYPEQVRASEPDDQAAQHKPQIGAPIGSAVFRCHRFSR